MKETAKKLLGRTALVTVFTTLATLFLCLTASSAHATQPLIHVRSLAPGWVNIDWGHEGGANYISVERESPAVHWVRYETGGQILDTGLEASTTYRYKGCAWYSGTPDCTEWVSVTTLSPPPVGGGTPPPVGGGTPPPVGGGTPPPPKTAAVIYAITINRDLEWMRHEGRDDGSNRWAANHRAVVGDSWDFKQVFSGGSDGYGTVIYAIRKDNELVWYKHLGRNDASFSWHPNSGAVVGHNWNFKHVFSDGGGFIYAIAHNGDLHWYHHRGRLEGTFNWNPYSGTKIGNGWGNFRARPGLPGQGQLQVFSPGNGTGIIYAITQSGDLLWYQFSPLFGHDRIMNNWANGGKGTKVGQGWNFYQVFADFDVIYAIDEPGGTLYWYRHLGQNDGTNRWVSFNGKPVAFGLYRPIFGTVFSGW